MTTHCPGHANHRPSAARGRRSRARRRGHALALGIVLSGACATHDGAGWHEEARASVTPVADAGPPGTDASAPTVRLFAFGDAGAQTRSQRQVTAELDRVLAQVQPVQGAREIPVVLWLGNHFGDAGPAARDAHGPCAAADALWGVPERAELAAVIRRHRAAGLVSLAVLGPNDWQCDAPEALFSSGEPGAQPWVMPTYNYVARVLRGGAVRVASTCTEGATVTCALAEDEEDALLELVLLDSSPWNQPQVDDRPTPREAASLSQQRALLAALQERGRAAGAAPLRVLVTHHPIESAGPHGQGGLAPDSAFFYALPALQEAIDAGLFAGAISAHDRSLQVSADISAGVKRSSRYWLDFPVFQIVAGATSRPDGRPGAGRRSWRWYKGQALIPDLISSHAGFAELVVSADAPELRAVLHAYRRGRWREGVVAIPRARPRHPAESPSPGMEPCVGCDSRPPRPQ